jgi:purine nucleosidase
VSWVFLIDTDTASDDAVALIMALRTPDVHVAAITTVAGNVDVDRATANALLTVERSGASVPVYRGSDQPLARPLRDARWFHGNDGLGDRGYPPARRNAEPRQAVDAIIDTIRANPGLVVVTLGPLTNLARALDAFPQIVSMVGRCVVMGGNPDGVGNVTPAAEFNIWVDPEAARIVLRSGLPIELIGWQLSRGVAVVSPQDIEFIGTIPGELARFAVECNCRAREAYRAQTGEDGISLPDPIAMAIAIDPSIGTHWSRHYTDVETTSDLTRGMTVVDRLNLAGNEVNRETWKALLARGRTVNVCWSIDIERWKAMLYRALR